MRKVCPVPPVDSTPDPRLAVISKNTVVLFDPATGQVMHVHQVSNYPGAMVKSPSQLEADAMLNYTAMRPVATRNVAALYVAGANPMCVGKTYKVVDCKLVEG